MQKFNHEIKCKRIFLFLLPISILLNSCIDPYTPKTDNFENVLVVECVLSNQMEYQKVRLSKVNKLDDESNLMEEHAQVWIEDSNANHYSFIEKEPGIYFSEIVFKANNNIDYTLYFKTKTGNEYESRKEHLTKSSQLDNLYVKKVFNNGVEGVQVFVDGETTDESKYIRYEYEETFKVLTPHRINQDIILLSPDDVGAAEYEIEITASEEKKWECYTTQNNIRFILNYTEDNNIQEFPIRFISSNQFMIRQRYSILVKQITQSFDAFNYYKILNTLGSIQSLIVENQTGFVTGNMISKDNSNEKVIGFFEVANVSSKRIYFSYSDFDFERPNYPYTCVIDTFDYRDNTTLDKDRNDRLWMYQYVQLYDPPWELLEVFYVEEHIPMYVLLSPECGNCASFSSHLKPNFWED